MGIFNLLHNGNAAIDTSSVANGYITYEYIGAGQVMAVLLHDKKQMVFPLDARVFVASLTMGDGVYKASVYKGKMNVLTKRFRVSLGDSCTPYLCSNSWVDLDSNPLAVAQAEALCNDKQRAYDKVIVIYDWIRAHVTYNYPKATGIKPGYIPRADATLISRNGICSDYCSLMAVMLRSQGIPCRIVSGNLNGTAVRHAWVEVYIDNRDADVRIRMWQRFDPTLHPEPERLNNSKYYKADYYL